MIIGTKFKTLIVAPITYVLKKNNFEWIAKTKLAFEKLKEAVTQPLVLALLDFTQPFTIECDASLVEVGAMLMERGRPITFLVKC